MTRLHTFGLILFVTLFFAGAAYAQIVAEEEDIGKVNETGNESKDIPLIKPTLSVASEAYEVVATTEDAKYSIVKEVKEVGEVDAKEALAGETEVYNPYAISLYDTVKDVVTILTADDKGEVADGPSDHIEVDANGRFAVFHSWATNLIDGSPACANVYLKDAATGWIAMLRPQALAPNISTDGNYVVYEYVNDFATGTPAIYRYEVNTAKEMFIDYSSLGNTKGGWYSPNPMINADGSVITYHTTKNGYPEVWEWNNGVYTKVRDGTL